MFIKLLVISFCYIIGSTLILSSMHRSALTESLLRKYADDEKHKEDQHLYWYELNLTKIDSTIQQYMVQLGQDEETSDFLTNCYEKSDTLFRQMWHLFAVPFLKMFMTQTNVNGYLERGSMFVYSNSQFQTLLSVDKNWTADVLLDLGAGDGKVTEKMAPHFNKVYVTEVSAQMVKHLKAKGYEVLDIEGWDQQKYDVISCLNLLDRCDKPMTLLRSMRAAVKPDGFVIVASVHPFSPYVEENDKLNYQPTEKLCIENSCIEEQINYMIKDVFLPAGFKLHSCSRVPYLCEGDLTHSFYVLSDIIFVLKPDNNEIMK